MFLDRIIATKHQEVERLKSDFSLKDSEQTIAELPPCRGFEKALSISKKRSLGLIAEVKKASPSKGLIRPSFDPVAIAKEYETAGADCISVLTDVEYFQGSNEYLVQVREHVQLPILRKEFIIDYRQIYETRLLGADAILLIAAVLTPQQLAEFHSLATDLGLDVLIEVHDQEELETVLELDSSLIGINNRNLRTFVTDIKTTEQLVERIPKGKTIVSESGISRPEEIEYLRSVGADAVLIGEHFMRQTEISQAIDHLMGPIITK